MDSAQARPLNDILQVMTSKTAEDVSLVTRAYELSKEAHKDQKRYSGDNYFIHPAEVAYYLSEAGMDSRTVAAGLLHDTIEDAGVSAKRIEEEFGAEVLHLV